MAEIITLNCDEFLYIGKKGGSDAFMLEARKAVFPDLPDTSILRTEKGAPFYADGKAFVSLSHKDDFCVAAVSTHPIGVDVEKESNNIDYNAISKRFFNTELASVQKFLRYWTGREALCKLHSEGLFPLRDYEGSVSYTKIGEYVVAVAK